MGAYTSCTVFCDHEKRRVKSDGGPYEYNCSNEPSEDGIKHCSGKIVALCEGGDEACDFPAGCKPKTITSAILKCPKEGLSETEFVSLVFGVVFAILLLMGMCQYIVGWANIKERKIYKKLAKLNRIKRRNERKFEPGPEENNEVLNPHVSMEEVLLQEEDSKSTKEEGKEGVEEKNQGKSGSAPVLSEAALQNNSEGPTNVKQARSVPVTLASTTETGENDSDASEELEETSPEQDRQQKVEEKARRVLKPLREAMWMGCGCQMAVVLGVFTCFVIMCYAFIHYKPKVEEDAKGPSHTGFPK